MLRSLVWLLIGLTALLTGICSGQNLVPNGGFETYRNCPKLDNLLEEAIPWFNPSKATPDFYHQCYAGNQMVMAPHSGKGYGQLFFDRGWFEYMSVGLTKPLVAGECYYAEFFVATNTPNKYLTETLGIYLSTKPVSLSNTEKMPASPQVLDRSPSINMLRWQRVSGVVEAKGGEAYLTIGSFYKEPLFLGFYYVFIDDVSLIPMKLDLGADTTLCGRDATYQLDATTPDAIDYLWNDGSKNATLLVKKPGRYSVTVKTSCKTLKDSITVDYQLDFNLGNDTTLCLGQTATLAVPLLPDATYRWQDGTSASQHIVDKAGTYSVQVKQATCTATDTIRVRYVQSPTLELGPDQALCGAQTFTIRPLVADGTFFWQDNFADKERLVNSSGVYWASVRNDCTTITDSIRISYDGCDCVLNAPNSFTPNDDGLNDVFFAYGCGDMTITSFSVFNRWGEPIFYTDKQPFQWDGFYRGQRCPGDVYVWHITYQFKQGKQLVFRQEHGQLNLIR